MPNYKEQTSQAVAWQRAYQVVIDNKLNTIPNITFYEEEVVLLPAGHVNKTAGHITELLQDPINEFPLLNPETGDVVGTAKYMDCYVLLHSLYMYLVNKRDNPPISIPLSQEEQPIE